MVAGTPIPRSQGGAGSETVHSPMAAVGTLRPGLITSIPLMRSVCFSVPRSATRGLLDKTPYTHRTG